MMKTSNIPKRAFLALLASGLSVVFIAFFILYNSTMNHQRLILQQYASGLAELIISVAGFDSQYNSNYLNGAKGATLEQIINAEFEKAQFGDTGEFIVVRKQDDQIIYLNPSRFTGANIPSSNIYSPLAEAERRAVLGESGFLETTDYRGVKVLVGYQPIPLLDAGVLVKVDIVPFQEGFTINALWSALGVIVLSLIFSILICKSKDISSHPEHSVKILQQNLAKTRKLIISLFLIGAFSVTSSLMQIYPQLIDYKYSQFSGLAKAFTSFIDSVAVFDEKNTEGNFIGSANDATRTQITKALIVHRKTELAVEIVLGMLSGEEIVFLLPAENSSIPPNSISLQNVRGGPIQLAVSGKSGVIIAKDYNNIDVVAAYEHIPHLNLGLVIKEPLTDVQRPFLLMALSNSVITIFIIILCSMLAPKILGFSHINSLNRSHISRQTSPNFLLIASGLSVALFILDILISPSLMGAIPYMALIMIGNWLPEKRQIYILSSLATFFLVAALLLTTPETGIQWEAVTNRAFVLIIIWLMAITVVNSKESDKATQDSEKRLNAMLESAPEATIIVHENGHIIFANKQASELFVYDRDTLRQMYLEDLLPKKYQKSHKKLRTDFMAAGNSYLNHSGNHIKGRDKNGRIFPIEISLNPMSLEDGTYMAASVRDITNRLQEEQELRKAIETAESATATKSAFLATMSHEIRTPLNGVVGMADLLQETTLDSDQNQMLTVIRDSSFSLMQIINDILDFSKIEAGKLTIEKFSSSMVELCEGVAETLLPVANHKRVKLTTYIDPNIPDWVLADPVRLRQILFNLTGNAVKFTDTRKNTETIKNKIGEVSLRAERVKKNDETVWVKFIISDNGIGMNQTTIDNLFTPFTQADTSTTRKFGGTGLGLSICQNLTKLMDGEIHVKSIEGEGSTFSITFPFDIDYETKEDDYFDLAGLKILASVQNYVKKEAIEDYLRCKQAKVDVIDSLDPETVIEEIRLARSEKRSYDLIVISSEWDQQDCDTLVTNVRKEFSVGSFRFLCLTADRRVKKGMIMPDLVIVESDPIRYSTLVRGAAIAVGRASPDIDMDTEDTSASTVLSVKEAEAKNELILIVEDNITNQKVIMRQLNHLGYTAEIANDGEEGLDAWSTGRYFLILSDCHMPNLDGFGLTAAVRQAEKTQPEKPRIPIIAITANALQGEAERCVEAGMDDYLSKPLEMPKLHRILKKYMPHKSTVQEDGVKQKSIKINAEPKEQETVKQELNGSVDNIKLPVDVNVIKEMFDGDDDLVREILPEFVEPAIEIHAAISTAFNEKDMPALGAEFHKLKSSSKAIGAITLGEICEQLEHDSKAGDESAVNNLMPDYEKEYNDTLAFIRDY